MEYALAAYFKGYFCTERICEMPRFEVGFRIADGDCQDVTGFTEDLANGEEFL